MSAKVSKLGAGFFAHYRRPESCAAAGESAIHLELKALVAAKARALGYPVEVEAVGDGWRADVLTTSANGQRIAWEVQRSPIAPEDVAARMRRHRDSGVTTLWLAKRDWPWCADVGALVVPNKSPADLPWTVESGTCGWEPVVDLAGCGAEWIPEQRELEAVVSDVLQGGLSLEHVTARDQRGWPHMSLQLIPRRAMEDWAAARGPTPDVLPARLSLAWDRCYRCHRQTVAVIGIQPFDPSSGHQYELMSAEHPGVLERIREEMTDQIRSNHELPIGVIKLRHSKTAGQEYLSNGCYWCDALLGNWYLFGAGAISDNVNDESVDDDTEMDDPRPIIGPIRTARLRKMQRQARSLFGSERDWRLVTWASRTDGELPAEER